MSILLVVAGLPLFWQPLRGDTPRVRKDIAENPKQKAELTTSQSQIGTAAAPLIVETHTRPESNAEATKAQADKEHASFIETWTLVFTGAVAVFTGLLVWIGWRGVNAANETLRSIEKQTKAITEGQRPRITAKAHGNPTTTIAEPTPRIEMELINRGLTPAYDFVYESWIEILPDRFTDFTQGANYYKAPHSIVVYP